MDTALEYTKRLADLLRVERGITADFLLALADFDRRKLWREREAELVAASILPAKVIPTRTTVTPIRRAAASSASDSADQVSLSVVRPGELNPPERVAVPVEPAPVSAAEASAPFALALAATPPPRAEVVTPLDAELVRLNVTVSREFLAKLEAAKDALGHVFPDGNAADILERGLDLVLAEHARRMGPVEKPRKARPSSNPRHVPAALKREVWKRAGGRCEFILASGERCGCTRRLEFDHVEPVALVLRRAQDERSRALTADDVRLCCRDHNQLAARRVFGDAVMDRYARRRGGGLRRARGDERAGALPFPTRRASPAGTSRASRTP